MMTKWHGFALPAALAGLLAAGGCLAGEGVAQVGAFDGAGTDMDCEAAYAALPGGTILDLLDPDAPDARRQAALEAYQRLATLRGCPEFGYTLGQLYRHGSGLPGNLVEQDVPRARELIRPMAESGYLNAFADLAEMEMRHANSRETMQWTQVYLHFLKSVYWEYEDDVDERRYQRSAYNGNLLTRAEIIWKWPVPALPRRLIREDLNAYLARHGTTVSARMHERLQGLHRRASAQEPPQARIANDPGTCYVTRVHTIGAAAAAWIVEVHPSGEKGRVVLENFVPNPEVTELMKECLDRVQFAPFEGSSPVTVRYSMVLGSTGGASMRRSGRR